MPTPVLTPRMQRILQRADGHARERGDDYVGTEHVLLAILDDPGGIASSVIARLGQTDAIRAYLLAVLDSPSAAAGPTPPTA